MPFFRLMTLPAPVTNCVIWGPLTERVESLLLVKSKNRPDRSADFGSVVLTFRPKSSLPPSSTTVTVTLGEPASVKVMLRGHTMSLMNGEVLRERREPTSGAYSAAGRVGSVAIPSDQY